jgi:hypothetical protein
MPARPDIAEVLSDLNRAKVLFQRRALIAALQINDQPAARSPAATTEGDVLPCVTLTNSEDVE